MTEKKVTLELSGGRKVTAIATAAQGRSKGWTFLYAPGAGSNVHDPFGVYACRRLAAGGIACARIQFPYMEERKRRPDPPRVLEATWRAAIEALRPKRGRLVVGGRSMGGRIASLVAAQGAGVDALALFAYPLHPIGKPDQPRVEHLPDISVPTFFCSGTRDSFGTAEQLSAAAKKVKDSTLHVLEGADHGFSVRKSDGRTRDEVWEEAVDVFAAWLKGL